MKRGLVQGFIRSLTLLAMLGLPGCAWLLGHDRLPVPVAREVPDVPLQRFQSDHLTATFAWDGPGALMATAYHPWGRVSRAVNPYGNDVWCIRVRLERVAGDVPVILLPERATLQMGIEKPLAALNLTDFRRKWPKWAVSNDEEAADRQVAYAHILDTLLIERQILPGSSVEGILAFVRRAPRDTARLTLPYRAGPHTFQATAHWEFHR